MIQKQQTKQATLKLLKGGGDTCSLARSLSKALRARRGPGPAGRWGGAPILT